MSKKTINKEATIQKILDKCNSSIGYSIKVDKFNKHPKTDEFLKDCCGFLEIEVVYND